MRQLVAQSKSTRIAIVERIMRARISAEILARYILAALLRAGGRLGVDAQRR